MASSKLVSWFPQVLKPIVISAPMLGASNGTLAGHVSKAGGVGMIPGGFDFAPKSEQLDAVSKQLTDARTVLGLQNEQDSTLPVGVGFILTHASVTHFASTALPLLQQHKPRAVWLFAPDPDRTVDGQPVQAHVISVLRRHGPSFVVFVQVGSVRAARQAVQDGADVIVAQGMDAGGHQFAHGAGVISLVPEIRSMLDDEFPGKQVVVVAAGGLVDGRGVAAALALGADAAVIGTRFIVAKETSAPEFKQKAILETVDGGVTTTKSYFHDTILGNASLWPKLYDGRAIKGKSFEDDAAGVSMDENLAKFKEAQAAGDTSRNVTWSGTGVGLVKQALPAAEIVAQTREEARKAIRSLQSYAE